MSDGRNVRRGPIGYLANQHPMASTTFVRREIAAIEGLGEPVIRYTIRRWPEELVDPDDLEESRRTRSLLGEGPTRLLAALFRQALTNPRRFCRALAGAMRLSRAAGGRRLHHLAYLAEACLLKSWQERDEIRHLHVHFGTNSAAVAMLCRILGGAPYSFTVHGPEEFDDPVGLSLGEKIRHAEFAVAISSFGRSQLWRWCDYRDWPKIEVIRCGLDRSFLDAEPNPPPGVPRFINVGRLVEQKGQALLLEASALLRDRGEAFELLLIGGGALQEALERRISELDLGGIVKLLGWQPGARVREELLASRAMVLPSFAEGLPVVLMEAMALGRPVITTTIAGIPELVRPGENGWLVPAGDIEGLADAMAEALAAPVEVLARMGRAGADRVRTMHDGREEARKLLARIERNASARAGQAEP